MRKLLKTTPKFRAKTIFQISSLLTELQDTNSIPSIQGQNALH